MRRLSAIGLGETGIIDHIEGSGGIAQRLMALNFLPGEMVRFVGIAPLGDPIAIEIANSKISLRRLDASCIILR